MPYSRSRKKLLLASLSLAVGLSSQALPVAAAATGDPQLTILKKAAQPRMSRPVLDQIKQAAKNRGIGLKQAIDEFVSKSAKNSVAATANWPDGPVTIPDVMIDDLTAVELEDLQGLADAQGVTLEEAIDRHGYWRKFKSIANELRVGHPQEFSGASRAQDGSSVWFGFKGAVPQEAVKLAGTLPVEVTLEGNRGYSEQDLISEQQRTHQAAMMRPEVSDAATGYSVVTGKVHVTAQLREGFTAKSAETAAAITSKLSRENSPIEVEVVTTTRKIQYEAQDNWIRGGGSLDTCTAGFNLKYATTDTKRLGTAGHCVRNQSSRSYFNQAADGGSTTVSGVWWEQGNYGDIGYYDHGTMDPTRTFYYGSGEKRYADYRDPYPAVGDPVCRYGITTGRHCGAVIESNICAGSVCGLTLSDMESGTHCRGGDSGGPWFNGGTAYAIHGGATDYYGTGKPLCAGTHVSRFNSARSYVVWTRY